MNNDLISREALKISFKEHCCGECDCCVHQKEGFSCELIDDAPTVEEVSVIEFKEPLPLVKTQKIVKALSNRPQGDIKKYKPLEPDYNVQCAVENLKTAYWSNEPEKDAKNFTEAEDIIISAICHHGYIVCKQPQGEWIPCSERLPDDMKKVLVWYEYYRYGDFNCMYQTYGFCYVCDGKWSPFINGETGWTDARIIAWQPLPEPYDSEVHDD